MMDEIWATWIFRNEKEETEFQHGLFGNILFKFLLRVMQDEEPNFTADKPVTLGE
jgi:hypothetical protein